MWDLSFIWPFVCWKYVFLFVSCVRTMRRLLNAIDGAKKQPKAYCGVTEIVCFVILVAQVRLKDWTQDYGERQMNQSTNIIQMRQAWHEKIAPFLSVMPVTEALRNPITKWLKKWDPKVILMYFTVSIPGSCDIYLCFLVCAVLKLRSGVKRRGS